MDDVSHATIDPEDAEKVAYPTKAASRLGNQGKVAEADSNTSPAAPIAAEAAVLAMDVPAVPVSGADDPVVAAEVEAAKAQVDAEKVQKAADDIDDPSKPEAKQGKAAEAAPSESANKSEA